MKFNLNILEASVKLTVNKAKKNILYMQKYFSEINYINNNIPKRISIYLKCEKSKTKTMLSAKSFIRLS